MHLCFPVTIVGGSNATLRSSDKNLIVNSGGGFDTILIQNAGLVTTNITSSGNISASGDIIGDTVTTSGNITSGDRIIATGRIIGSSTVQGTEGIFTAGVNTTHVTASGNISASGDIFGGNVSASGQIAGNSFKVDQYLFDGSFTGIIISGSTFDSDNRDAQIVYPNHGLHFNDDSGTNNHVLALQGNAVGIRMEPEGGGDALQVSGSIVVTDGNINATHISASGNITASGNISSSKFIGGGLEIEGPSSIKIDSETSGMEIFGNIIEMGGRDESKLMVISGLNGSGTGRVMIGDVESDFNGAHLDIQVGKVAAHFNGLNVTGIWKYRCNRW